MRFLFNSDGRCIAIENGQRLYALSGQNIGCPVAGREIFVDLDGRYLGEILGTNHLMWRKDSPHQQVNYGANIEFGGIGNFSNPPQMEKIKLPPGFSDIETPWLGEG
jgi:hypothetical protein